MTIRYPPSPHQTSIRYPSSPHRMTTKSPSIKCPPSAYQISIRYPSIKQPSPHQISIRNVHQVLVHQMTIKYPSNVHQMSIKCPPSPHRNIHQVPIKISIKSPSKYPSKCPSGCTSINSSQHVSKIHRNDLQNMLRNGRYTSHNTDRISIIYSHHVYPSEFPSHIFIGFSIKMSINSLRNRFGYFLFLI